MAQRGRQGRQGYRSRRGRRNRRMEQLARERIALLLDQAHRWAGEGKLPYAHRCAELARRIAMRYNQRLTRAQRRLVCRGCDRWLQPGVTSRVRLSRKGWTVVTCLGCGRHYRYPHRHGRAQRERRERRSEE